MISWNYIGIDEKPPRRVQLLILTSSGLAHISDSNNPNMIAWAPIPDVHKIKQRCQIILRGLPELRMIACIAANPVTCGELETALDNFWEEDLATFVDLVRALDHKAHSVTLTLPNHT